MSDVLFEKLDGLKTKPAGGWIARCPAHDDHNPSLSIDKTEGGQLLLHCHAGCTVDAILKALELPTSVLRPGGSTEVSETTQYYVYEDADGVPLYRVVRRPGKEFHQERYVESIDGFQSGMDGVELVPYRLADWFDTPKNQTVFICEGEKDVHACIEQGLLATCNPGGAGKWRDSYSEYLRGRYVTIVQDNDEVGRKHASHVMLSLRGKAARVRLVAARRGKDAFDHFAAGYDVDDFVEPSLFDPIDFTKPVPDVDWLMEGYVARGDLALWAGVPGLGKSWVLMALAVAVANGENVFLGKPIPSGRVLYFDEENPLDVIQTRLVHKLGLRNFEALRYIAGSGLRLDTHPESLINEAMIFDPDLIVIDSLARVHAKEENSFAEMSEILNGVLKPLARDMNAAVMLIHHHDKAGHGPRGSGDIEAAVDVAIDLNGQSGNGSFAMKIRKSRRSKSPEPVWVEIQDIPGLGTRLVTR